MAAIWSSLELNIGIMCSCLPTLKPYVVRIFPRFFTSAKGSASGHAVLTIGGGASTKQRSTGPRPDDVGLKYLVKSDVYEGSWNGEDVQCSFVQPGESDVSGMRGIRVLTSVKQESRRGTMDRFGDDDTESTKDLVRDAS